MFSGAEPQVYKLKTVLEMDGGDGCTIALMYLGPLTRTVRKG